MREKTLQKGMHSCKCNQNNVKAVVLCNTGSDRLGFGVGWVGLDFGVGWVG